MRNMIFMGIMMILVALSRPVNASELHKTLYSFGSDSLVFVGETDTCEPAQLTIWFRFRPEKRRVFGEERIFMCRCWMLTCTNIVLRQEQLWHLSRMIWPFTDDISLSKRVTMFLETETFTPLEGERTYEL